MTRNLSYTFPAGNTSDVCAIQTSAGAGNLILNGNLANQVVGNVSLILKGYSRQVSLTSANNLSGVTFTITGTQNGVVITEDIVGPNANTVYGALVYDIITSVSADNAANQVSVGTGWSGFFPLIGINLEKDIINYTITIAKLTAASVSFSVYGSIANIVNNRQTYAQNLNSNSNLIQIQAPGTTANYVYSGLTGAYAYILIQLGADVGTIANSMQLNFYKLKGKIWRIVEQKKTL